MEGFLYQASIYLAAAVIAVPIAARLGLGSVLGYLAAGIMIGPVLGLVGAETKDLQHFAEFGVVMMLFLIGLELEPRALWDMRHRLLGLGGLQVVLSTAALMGGCDGLRAAVGHVAGDWLVALAQFHGDCPANPVRKGIDANQRGAVGVFGAADPRHCGHSHSGLPAAVGCDPARPNQRGRVDQHHRRRQPCRGPPWRHHEPCGGPARLGRHTGDGRGGCGRDLCRGVPDAASVSLHPFGAPARDVHGAGLADCCGHFLSDDAGWTVPCPRGIYRGGGAGLKRVPA